MAGKLVLEFEGRKLLERDLDKESILIGRRPTSDIQIDNLAVSGTHARVLTILNDSFLEDMDSTNGVFVNGRRVRKHALRHGDVVGIGKHELHFENPDAVPDEDAYAETILLGPDASALAQASTPDTVRRASAAGGAPEAGGATIGRARLRMIVDGGAGKELELTKALTTIGKPGVQIAAISRRAQGDFIVHVEGDEGGAVPRVNGEPIGFKSKLLKHEDEIEIAGVRMRYLLGS
jgi:ribosome-associated protein YbcJ (S4-like RNA binding protein)